MLLQKFHKKLYSDISEITIPNLRTRKTPRFYFMQREYISYFNVAELTNVCNLISKCPIIAESLCTFVFVTP